MALVVAWDVTGKDAPFPPSLDPAERGDAETEIMVPSCLSTTLESAGGKRKVFLPIGPQHAVSKLAILRKGQLNQPLPSPKNVLGIFRSLSNS